MPYVIRTRDKAGAHALRLANRDAHIAYLLTHTHRILAAGAFLADDGSIGEGGMIVLDTEDRADAERLIADDPYTKAGLFESVEIVRWRKVFFNGEKLL